MPVEVVNRETSIDNLSPISNASTGSVISEAQRLLRMYSNNSANIPNQSLDFSKSHLQEEEDDYAALRKLLLSSSVQHKITITVGQVRELFGNDKQQQALNETQHSPLKTVNIVSGGQSEANDLSFPLVEALYHAGVRNINGTLDRKIKIECSKIISILPDISLENVDVVVSGDSIANVDYRYVQQNFIMQFPNDYKGISLSAALISGKENMSLEQKYLEATSDTSSTVKSISSKNLCALLFGDNFSKKRACEVKNFQLQDCFDLSFVAINTIADQLTFIEALLDYQFIGCTFKDIIFPQFILNQLCLNPPGFASQNTTPFFKGGVLEIAKKNLEVLQRNLEHANGSGSDSDRVTKECATEPRAIASGNSVNQQQILTVTADTFIQLINNAQQALKKNPKAPEAMLRGLTVTGDVDFSTLKNKKLTGLHIENCTFQGAVDFTGCDLRKLHSQHVIYQDNVTIDNANLINAHFNHATFKQDLHLNTKTKGPIPSVSNHDGAKANTVTWAIAGKKLDEQTRKKVDAEITVRIQHEQKNIGSEVVSDRVLCVTQANATALWDKIKKMHEALVKKDPWSFFRGNVVQKFHFDNKLPPFEKIQKLIQHVKKNPNTRSFRALEKIIQAQDATQSDALVMQDGITPSIPISANTSNLGATQQAVLSAEQPSSTPCNSLATSASYTATSVSRPHTPEHRASSASARIPDATATDSLALLKFFNDAKELKYADIVSKQSEFSEAVKSYVNLPDMEKQQYSASMSADILNASKTEAQALLNAVLSGNFDVKNTHLFGNDNNSETAIAERKKQEDKIVAAYLLLKALNSDAVGDLNKTLREKIYPNYLWYVLSSHKRSAATQTYFLRYDLIETLFIASGVIDNAETLSAKSDVRNEDSTSTPRFFAKRQSNKETFISDCQCRFAQLSLIELQAADCVDEHIAQTVLQKMEKHAQFENEQRLQQEKAYCIAELIQAATIEAPSPPKQLPRKRATSVLSAIQPIPTRKRSPSISPSSSPSSGDKKPAMNLEDYFADANAMLEACRVAWSACGEFKNESVIKNAVEAFHQNALTAVQNKVCNAGIGDSCGSFAPDMVSAYNAKIDSLDFSRPENQPHALKAMNTFLTSELCTQLGGASAFPKLQELNNDINGSQSITKAFRNFYNALLDTSKPISNDILTALRSYEEKPFVWMGDVKELTELRRILNEKARDINFLESRRGIAAALSDTLKTAWSFSQAMQPVATIKTNSLFLAMYQKDYLIKQVMYDALKPIWQCVKSAQNPSFPIVVIEFEDGAETIRNMTFVNLDILRNNQTTYLRDTKNFPTIEAIINFHKLLNGKIAALTEINTVNLSENAIRDFFQFVEDQLSYFRDREILVAAQNAKLLNITNILQNIQIKQQEWERKVSCVINCQTVYSQPLPAVENKTAIISTVYESDVCKAKHLEKIAAAKQKIQEALNTIFDDVRARIKTANENYITKDKQLKMLAGCEGNKRFDKFETEYQQLNNKSNKHNYTDSRLSWGCFGYDGFKLVIASHLQNELNREGGWWKRLEQCQTPKAMDDIQKEVGAALDKATQITQSHIVPNNTIGFGGASHRGFLAVLENAKQALTDDATCGQTIARSRSALA